MSTEHVSSSKYFEDRVKFLNAMKEAGINPYPHKFSTTMDISSYIEKYGGLLGTGECMKDVEVSLAGRVTSKRVSSSKLTFYNLNDGASKVQVVAEKAASELGTSEFSKFHSSVRCYDIVGVVGSPGKTRRGELSIFIKSLIVLSPCLHMMMSSSSAITAKEDQGRVWVPGGIRNPELYVLNHSETRYHQRYLDLILNCEVREIFKTRSKVISYVRRFLNNLNFLEVETPIATDMIPGGGSVVSPFVTHHNDLNRKLYLRTTPEFYLKQLVLGGLNRVYEIGKQFSNGSIDMTHNPEFTTAMFFMAFADYNHLMDLTEKMLSRLLMELTGSFVIKCHSSDFNREPINIDFTPPFRRIDVIEELEKIAELSIPKNLAGEEANEYLMDACLRHNLKGCSSPQTSAVLLDKLVGHFVKPTCVNPTFLMNHPRLLRPFSKCHQTTPGLTESFELIVNQHHICKGYTELNDLLLAHQRFSEDRPSVGEDEAMIFKERCRILEYGLPPMAGWESSIDYLTMLLTDSQNMREVVLFPAMRPQNQPGLLSSSMASSVSTFRIVVVGDIHEDWEHEHDLKALQFLYPNLVLFTGDFGNENVELVRGIAAGVDMPKAAILGNHDSWSTCKFSSKIKDGVQLQLECLGEQHVGYNHLHLPSLKLSVVGGRPFSCGGDQLFRKKLLTKRYGVHSMEESAHKIHQAAVGTPEEHSVIVLAHNGPSGLGSNKDDICGKDWENDGGDQGDPDLAQAIALIKETNSNPIPLVVFGHMHKELVNGGNRKMIAIDGDDTMYLNAAIVPRVKHLSFGGSSRAFTVVDFSNGKISRVAETWVLVSTDGKTSMGEEHVLFGLNGV